MNELLSGEHISAEEYKGIAEENISKLLREKQIAHLKPVKYLFSICADITLFVSVVELSIGIIGSFKSLEMLQVMLMNASVWFILFIASLVKLMYDKHSLKKMKQNGDCVDSEIVEILPAMWIRVGNFISCRVVCRYIYNGSEHKAISRYYVLTPFIRKEDLHANIYVEKSNSLKYSVELFRRQ